jgi:hypothetical protein
MNDNAKAAMLAALNAGEAVDPGLNSMAQKKWGIVSTQDGWIMFEPHRTKRDAYEAHAQFFRDTPAHVVSRLGGWVCEV